MSDDGLVAGTYLHGVLAQPDVRSEVLRTLAASRGHRARVVVLGRPSAAPLDHDGHDDA